MAKSDYISQNDDAFAAQMQAFKNAIAAYAVLLGLTPAQVTAQAADADYFSYVIACRDLIRNAASQWSGWKSLLRAGGDLPPSGTPIAPVLPAAVAPGVEVLFRALVKQIKGHPAYSEAIGAGVPRQRHHPELHRQHAVPGHADEMDLPRHLPRWRFPRGTMEQTRQRNGWRIGKAVRQRVAAQKSRFVGQACSERFL